MPKPGTRGDNSAVPLLHFTYRACNAAQTEGITPPAPGRTSRAPPQGRFQPVTSPLFALVCALLFPFIAMFY